MQKEPIRFELHKETVAVLQTAEPSGVLAGCTCCSLSELTNCCGGSNDSPPTCCP